MHGPASDKKVQKLIVNCEEFFKYQQGYSSRALVDSVLEVLTGTMDSSAFQKVIGGAQSFLTEGCRAFWRESQQLAYVPTCVLRGVMEEHTTPEVGRFYSCKAFSLHWSCTHYVYYLCVASVSR